MGYIYYGIDGKYIDITYICYSFLSENGTITIPKNDNVRAYIFGDHLFGVLKHVKIGNIIYPHTEEIQIQQLDGLDNIEQLRQNWWDSVKNNVESPDKRLEMIHKSIRLDYGSMQHELPEQLMAVKYIQPTDRVLEIGGNIGRNSLVIATLLNDDKTQLVTLESFERFANQLKHNRDKNHYNFNVEASALSEVDLWQRGWDTYVQGTELLPLDATPVNTITYSELKEKYGINFNVLVADCEGALYQILKDTPAILSDIETVIIENDFSSQTEQQWVADLFEEYGLKLVYNRPLTNGPAKFNHCKDTFFQVFTKRL